MGEFYRLLEQAGHKPGGKGKRWICASCPPGKPAALAVDVEHELFCCHRCNQGGSLGTLRREPAMEFPRLRDLGLETRSDAEVLDYAAREQFIVVSSDVNTMTAEALGRVAAGQVMRGVFLVHQRDPLGPVIGDLILIWAASEAEEWIGQVRFLPFSTR